ncbi:hypothetical protein PybrP1_009813 [[Pythium] brassicae (nom. inval.)]|nr:hypothetical protein PybrP1_009813 [[Pythium] brassicae (nom. inval.)]
MAWGQRVGVQDLLDRLQQPATAKSLFVLSTRKLSDADAERLAASISANTTLEELYLSGHRLSATALRAFADCVAANRALQLLCIGDDAFGDAGVHAVCDALARNPQSALQAWDLEHKSVTATGASTLGQLLATNSTLTTLTLSRNALSDDGIRALLDGLRENPQPALQSLQLTDAGITGAALDHFAALLQLPTCSLQSLQLSFNSLEAANSSFFDALANNSSLKKLYLKDCKLTDAHLLALGGALQHNATLEEVDLSDNALTHAGCVALAHGLESNVALKVLMLSNNRCTDAGADLLARALASNKSLTKLDLSKNELSPRGVKALLEHTSVKELHVFNNTIGAGLLELLPVIAAHQSIEHLDMSANQLHGELSIALFDALHAHPTLRTLEMGGNSLGEHGHAALERLRHANPALDVAVDKSAQDENGHFNFGDE